MKGCCGGRFAGDCTIVVRMKLIMVLVVSRGQEGVRYLMLLTKSWDRELEMRILGLNGGREFEGREFEGEGVRREELEDFARDGF